MTDPMLPRQGDGTVELVGARLGKVEPHAEGGWPEFNITLRYLVKTDDLDAGEDAAKEFFAETDYRTDSRDA